MMKPRESIFLYPPINTKKEKLDSTDPTVSIRPWKQRDKHFAGWMDVDLKKKQHMQKLLPVLIRIICLLLYVLFCLFTVE